MLCVTTSVFWCLSHRQLSCLPIFWGFLFHPLDDFIESTHQAVSFANMKCQHKHRYIPKSSVLFLPIASITLHPTPTHTHQPVHSHKSYPSPQDSALASPNGWGSSVVLALKRDKLTREARQTQTTAHEKHLRDRPGNLNLLGVD